MNVTRNGLACVMRTSRAIYVQNLSQIVGVRSNVNTNANMSYLDKRDSDKHLDVEGKWHARELFSIGYDD